jgi:hypothetical protein
MSLVSSLILIRRCGPAAVLAGVLFVVNGMLTVTNLRFPLLVATSSIAVLLITYFDKAATLRSRKGSRRWHQLAMKRTVASLISPRLRIFEVFTPWK